MRCISPTGLYPVSGAVRAFPVVSKPVGTHTGRVSLRRIELRSPLVACSAQGQITLAPRDLPSSRMDIETVLRVPSERLRQELVPERTLQSIKDKGEVRARVRGTFRRPSLDVQP